MINLLGLLELRQEVFLAFSISKKYLLLSKGFLTAFFINSSGCPARGGRGHALPVFHEPGHLVVHQPFRRDRLQQELSGGPCRQSSNQKHLSQVDRVQGAELLQVSTF